MKQKPWQKISSRRIYHCAYIDFYRDEVINHLGRKVNYYYFRKTPFVAIIPLDQKGNIYFVRQYRYTLKKYTWELPMGSVNKGEGNLAAAKRELKEETALAAKKWKKIGEEFMTATVYPEHFSIFLAQDLKPTGSLPDPAEIDCVQKFSLKTIKKMIVKKEIVGAAILASLYQYHLYYKS